MYRDAGEGGADDGGATEQKERKKKPHCTRHQRANLLMGRYLTGWRAMWVMATLRIKKIDQQRQHSLNVYITRCKGNYVVSHFRSRVALNPMAWLQGHPVW